MNQQRIFEQRVSVGMPIAERLARRIRSPHFDSKSEAYLALVIAARAFVKYRDDNWEAFAQVSIRNRLIDLTRRKYPQTVDWQAVEAGDDERPELSSFAKYLARPDRAQARAERREFLARLRKGLTRAEKRLLLLRLRGKSQPQIARELGLSQPTVSRRLAALGLKARDIVREQN